MTTHIVIALVVIMATVAGMILYLIREKHD